MIDELHQLATRTPKRVLPSTKVVVPLLAQILTASAAQAAPQVSGAAAASLQSLSEKYSIKIEAAQGKFSVPWWSQEFHGREPSTEALKSYLPIFTSEWNLYPATLIAKTGLKRIVFCSELAFGTDRRGALPDFYRNTLYLDVEVGGENENYNRRGIHHEFFHMIDFRDDGELYSDSKWEALNPKEFEYGVDKQQVQHNRYSSILNARRAGFLNEYSTSGVEEDKAEMFSNMIVNGPEVDRRAQSDEFIRAKRDQMKKLLRKFCPEMNDQFWDRVGKLNRGPGPKVVKSPFILIPTHFGTLGKLTLDSIGKRRAPPTASPSP